jgi:hypothetical protein
VLAFTAATSHTNTGKFSPFFADVPWPSDDEIVADAAAEEEAEDHAADSDAPREPPLTAGARQAQWPLVRRLLTADPLLRPTAAALRSDPFFDTIAWDHLLSTPPPFVPAPESETDTTYFKI